MLFNHGSILEVRKSFLQMGGKKTDVAIGDFSDPSMSVIVVGGVSKQQVSANLHRALGCAGVRSRKTWPWSELLRNP